MRGTKLLTLIAALGVSSLVALTASALAQSTSTSERAVICRDVDLTRPMTADELQDAQMCQELSKLREEVTSLQAANQAMNSGFGFLLPWSGIVTGLAAALGALLVPSIGLLVRNSFEKSQRQKLEQERALQREQHNLKLMEGLGSPNRAVQLASISSLLRRIEEIKRQASRGLELETEMRTLSDVVVSVLRDPQIDEAVSKFLADEMINVFDLRLKGDEKRSGGHHFSLRDFNISRARLKGVYWAHVDAAGVDFFQADLSKASLRNADLTNAIFYETDLSASVLVGAKLRDANFKSANLEGADLSGADLSGAVNLADAVLTGIKWNTHTKWPEGFEPPVATAVA